MNEILYGAEEQQQQPLRAPRRSSYNNYRQHNAEAQLDQLLGPDSAADVDDIVRCFTAADALRVPLKLRSHHNTKRYWANLNLASKLNLTWVELVYLLCTSSAPCVPTRYKLLTSAHRPHRRR